MLVRRTQLDELQVVEALLDGQIEAAFGDVVEGFGAEGGVVSRWPVAKRRSTLFIWAFMWAGADRIMGNSTGWCPVSKTARPRSELRTVVLP